PRSARGRGLQRCGDSRLSSTSTLPCTRSARGATSSRRMTQVSFDTRGDFHMTMAYASPATPGTLPIPRRAGCPRARPGAPVIVGSALGAEGVGRVDDPARRRRMSRSAVIAAVVAEAPALLDATPNAVAEQSIAGGAE